MNVNRATMLTGVITALIAVPTLTVDLRALERPSVPFCLYEDGNPNGKPCLWVDPDTGAMYHVESENYR